MFVVPAESAISLTDRPPIAADLVSIDPPPTAAATVAPITAIPTSVAVECGDGEVTATTPVAVGHPPTTARAISVATVSVDRRRWIPLVVEPLATTGGLLTAAEMAVLPPCSP